MSGQMVAAHRDAMSFGINPPRGARAHGRPWDDVISRRQGQRYLEKVVGRGITGWNRNCNF